VTAKRHGKSEENGEKAGENSGGESIIMAAGEVAAPRGIFHAASK